MLDVCVNIFKFFVYSEHIENILLYNECDNSYTKICKYTLGMQCAENWQTRGSLPVANICICVVGFLTNHFKI